MAETINSPDVVYTPFRRDPMNNKRNTTDTVFLCILGVVFITWAGISLYAVCAEYESTFIHASWLQGFVRIINPAVNPILVPHGPKNDTYQSARHNVMGKFWLANNNTNDSDVGLFSIGYSTYHTFFGAIILACCFLILRWFPIISIVLGAIGLILYKVLLIVQTYSYSSGEFNLSKDEGSDSTALFLQMYHIGQTVLKFFFISFAMIGIIYVGVKTTIEIIKKAFRSTTGFLFLTMFGFIILLFYMVITSFTLRAVDLNSNTLKFLVLLCGTYICSFIYYFGKTVVYQTVATWHSIKEGKEIPISTVLRCISMIIRFHLGTVALAATIILPVILGIYVAIKTRFHGVRQCCNLFTQMICKLFLIPNLADFALIQSAIHGHSFVDATKRTFYIMGKHSSLSLVSIYIFNGFLMLISFVANSASILSCLGYMDRMVEGDTIFVLYAWINQFPDIHFYTMLLLPLTLIAEASVHATLLCTLEDKESEDGELGVKLSQIPNAVAEE